MSQKCVDVSVYDELLINQKLMIKKLNPTAGCFEHFLILK